MPSIRRFNDTSPSFSSSALKKCHIGKLENDLNDILERTARLQLENAVFESFIDSMDLSNLSPRMSLLQYDDDEEEMNPPEYSAYQRTLYMTAVNTERYRKLDAVKKCIVAHQEFWKCHNHAKQSKIQLSNIVTHHEIRLQEYEVELRDIAKSAALLRRFVETTGYNQRIKCIAAEKFEKFLKDSLKQKNSLCEDLKVKNMALLDRLQKMKTDSKVKPSEMDEISRPDFDRLVVLNKQASECLDSKMRALTKLKQKLFEETYKLSKKRTEMEFQLRRIQKIQKKNRLTMAHVQVTAASVNRMIESIQEEHILRQHLSHIQRRFVIPTLYDVHNVSVQNKQLTYELNKAKRQLQIAKANYLHHHTSWRHKLRQSRPESPDCS